MSPRYSVAVRALCEFTAKQGDLDMRFTPSPTAQQGLAGHLKVAQRRAHTYETEIFLSATHGAVDVRGRADGYDPVRNQLEEIKTHRGDLSRQPENHRYLHWAQAKLYGWMLCRERELAELNVALVYWDIGAETETVLTETYSADALQAFFEAQCARFEAWAAQELAHVQARSSDLKAMAFPFGAFRRGQRELSVAVYRAARDGTALLAQAPTGIGKTLGTLFPLLKRMGEDGLDRVFFLTAKSPGRQLALDALTHLTPRPSLRILELTAREKACEHPDRACHGESCPLARGFYDRLPAARAAAVDAGTMDRHTLRRLGLAHAVCPYYLAQELSRWCDVVVGDYNYYFDFSAALYMLTLQNEWRVGVLVDEAHNLVDRARAMYSAPLEGTVLRDARAAAPKVARRAIGDVARAWTAAAAPADGNYLARDDSPAHLHNAIKGAIVTFSEALDQQADSFPPDTLRLYFDLLHFFRMSELQDPNTIFDVAADTAPPVVKGEAVRPTLTLRNLIPARQLAPRFAAAETVTLFSATLAPSHYYRDTLGLPEATRTIDVAAPFTAEQLQVKLTRRVSTRYRDRGASLAPIADLMAAQFQARPGNYLSFTSSYDYLDKLADTFATRHPHVPVWLQTRRMDDAARVKFLARFEAGQRGIGFAVLGGAFGEGVDLPGDRLIGAFIATLGMPQVNDVNAQIEARMQTEFGAGYDYTYLFPGLGKVVQAAGRVIRDEADRGVVYLLDDRFARRDVRALLPSWWQVETV
ncbi:MAG: ATP-dependent DNA helicase [Achromobacter sp.]